MEVILYHNPRCSKSRQTLALLEQRAIHPSVIEYLQQPPDPDTLRALIGMLGIEPLELVRTGEAAWQALAVNEGDDEAVIDAIARHPILMQRPIVVHGGRARIGRPPEAVLEILP